MKKELGKNKEIGKELVLVFFVENNEYSNANIIDEGTSQERK